MSAPQSKALLTLVSSGDVDSQNGAFKGHGPFTITWATRRANPGSTNFAFFLNLDSSNIVVTHAPGKGSYILHADCTAGCTLAVNVTNVAYTVAVSQSALPYPHSKALLTLVSGGDVDSQNGAFKRHGPFTITWATHRANPGSTNFAFFLNLDSSNIVVTHAAGRGSYILRADCTAGCTLAVNVTNVAYAVTVSQ
jgi:hypothetical protein